MAIKQTAHIIRGLRKDFSDSKQPKEYAIDAKNIRITNREDSTLFSITNEKGTKDYPEIKLEGVLLGYCVINNLIVVFSKTDKDYITLLEKTNNTINSIVLYSGNLNFNTSNHIECLGILETSTLIKVYWVDGINQSRMLILDYKNNKWSLRNTKFDFVQNLTLNESINVDKIQNQGNFNSGVIQYAFSYFNKNGQESSIIEVTPINYISYEDRGVAPNEYVSNSFQITINNLDTNFDYVRLYSIHRPSLESIPTVKRLADISTTLNKGTIINDNPEDNPSIPEEPEEPDTPVDPSPEEPERPIENSKQTIYLNDGYLLNIENASQSMFTLNIIAVFAGDTSLNGNNCSVSFSTVDTENIIEIKVKTSTSWGVLIPEINSYLIRWGLTLSASESTFLTPELDKTWLIKDFIIYEARQSTYALSRRVVDSDAYYLSYIDDGLNGEIIDPTELLYKGGEYIIPKTIAQKDGTLFLGNLKTRTYNIAEEHIKLIQKSATISEVTYDSTNPDSTLIISEVNNLGYYPYKNSLYKNNSKITTFKARETYRLGVQLQHFSGKWSDPIFIDDYKVHNNPKCILNNGKILYTRTKLKVQLHQSVEDDFGNIISIISILKNLGYKRIRPIIVYPNDNEIEVLSQGILCSTVFNVEDRKNDNTTVQSSWFFRPIIKDTSDIETPTGFSYGSYTEFRHGYALPRSHKRTAELQNSIYESDNLDVLYNYEDKYNHLFGIDSSIVTFHSPEIELNKITNINDCKLRIIGVACMEANAPDIDIIVSTPGYEGSKGLQKQILLNNNIEDNRDGLSLVSDTLWNDAIFESKDVFEYANYLIYPWHKNGNISNASVDKDIQYSTLKYKKMSNLKYFNRNILLESYLEDIPLSGKDIAEENSITRLNISNNVVFSGTPKDTIKYKGAVDTLLMWNTKADFKYKIPLFTPDLDASQGFPLYAGTFTSDYIGLWAEGTPDKYVYSKDLISMKYKSSPHVVLALDHSIGDSEYSIKNILPILGEAGNQSSDIVMKDIDSSKNIIYSQSISIDSVDIPQAYMWLAELYREVSNKFGGDNYSSNIWYPAGKAVNLNSFGNTFIEFTQGDTFFSRFDSLKTYSDDLDAVNSVTEIGSFMVETRINLDSRYDRNRGKQSNLVMNPNNFNLFNNVYNQKNNFFNYRIVNKNIVSNTEFPNTIIWSKQKFASSEIDTWANINMISSTETDGIKGPITKIESFNNELFVFQPESINHILFNSRVQIPASDGVPIELANSYKVDGVRQLSSVGSSNPLAIKSTDRGIYYMDNITKGIYVFNGQQSESLSDKLGMNSWVKEQNIDSYKVNYDKINQDIYFINNDNCLSYSEKLGEFESFFDYNNSEIFNIKDGTYAINSNKLYKLFEGDYNKFFDSDNKNFWITFTHNENPFNDKIYNNLEFRADTWDKDTLLNISAFDIIKVDNEYQDTNEVSLEFAKYIPSNLKRKFRIWRANIPRDISNGRDRIRNTWANITLKASNPSNTKTELHDLIVSYFM